MNCPGQRLKMELEARGWTQTDFARIIESDAKTVSMIISGKRRITERMALLLEASLNIDALQWLKWESTHRLALHVSRKRGAK